MVVLIFGDSITQGFWDKSKGGWVARLRHEYDALKVDGEIYDPPALFNLGVSGDSTNELLVRFENEATVRATEETVIVIAAGVNDSRSHGDKMFSSTEQYQKNLEEILRISRKFTQKILFVGLTPCVEPRTNPVLWGSTCYTNERITVFDKVLKEFCASNSVDFVEILQPFSEAQARTELLPDGVHPNDKGHELIAALVKPRLQRLTLDQ